MVVSAVEPVEVAVAVDGAGDALALFVEDSREDGVVMIASWQRPSQR